MPAPVTYGAGVFLPESERVPVCFHRVGQVLAANVVMELHRFCRRPVVVVYDLALRNQLGFRAELVGTGSLGVGRVDSPDWSAE